MKALQIASNSIMLDDFIRHSPDKFHFMLARELQDAYEALEVQGAQVDSLFRSVDGLQATNEHQTLRLQAQEATIASYRKLLDCALRWRRVAEGNFSAESMQAYMDTCDDLEAAIDAFTQGESSNVSRETLT